MCLVLLYMNKLELCCPCLKVSAEWESCVTLTTIIIGADKFLYLDYVYGLV